jgi:hypothetical protein
LRAQGLSALADFEKCARATRLAGDFPHRISARGVVAAWWVAAFVIRDSAFVERQVKRIE